jgi:hypothetical protein
MPVMRPTKDKTSPIGPSPVTRSSNPRKAVDTDTTERTFFNFDVSFPSLSALLFSFFSMTLNIVFWCHESFLLPICSIALGPGLVIVVLTILSEKAMTLQGKVLVIAARAENIKGNKHSNRKNSFVFMQKCLMWSNDYITPLKYFRFERFYN